MNAAAERREIEWEQIKVLANYRKHKKNIEKKFAKLKSDINRHWKVHEFYGLSNYKPVKEKNKKLNAIHKQQGQQNRLKYKQNVEKTR